MPKKTNQTKFNEKLDLKNIKVGMTIPDSTKNPQNWTIDNNLIEQMRKYEQESGKSAIFRNKLTGMFLYFKYCEEHPEYLKKKNNANSKKQENPKDIKEIQNEEMKTDEDILQDAIEDYKSKFHVKHVNINSQKFKRFFWKWKNSS